MINLKEETLTVLRQNGKSMQDVLWVGCELFRIPIHDFWERLSNIVYDDGFGGVEIFDGLLVVGKDFWLERHEYDGHEWWEFKELPSMPETVRNVSSVLNDWHDSMSIWSVFHELQPDDEYE